jgi:2-aminoadipate transaminase
MPAGYRWSKPDGGMFIWLEGPEGLDAVKLYQKAVERNVAYVPGKFFFADPEEGFNTMRLNFTMSPEKILSGAVKTLAEVLKAAG